MNEGNYISPNASAFAAASPMPQIGVDALGLDQLPMVSLNSPSVSQQQLINNSSSNNPTTAATPSHNNRNQQPQHGATNSPPNTTMSHQQASDGQSPKQVNSQSNFLPGNQNTISNCSISSNSNPGSQGSQQSISSPNDTLKNVAGGGGFGANVDHYQTTSNQSSASNNGAASKNSNNNQVSTFIVKQEPPSPTQAYLAGRSSATLSDPSLTATPTPPSATNNHLNNSNSSSITNVSTPQPQLSSSMAASVSNIQQQQQMQTDVPANNNIDNPNGSSNTPKLAMPSNPGTSGNSSGSTPQTNGYTHPLLNSKHLCLICGDKASGKHYGVYSCEGCKGFFKRTVRKGLTFSCRENSKCLIDKRQRNRCQYCRYKKCIDTGMRREAVQEERQRTKDSEDNEVESTSNSYTDAHFDRLVGTTSIAPVSLNGTDNNGASTNVSMANLHGLGLRGPAGILTNSLAIGNSGILTAVDNGTKEDNNFLGRHHSLKMDDIRTSPVIAQQQGIQHIIAHAALNQIESLIKWATSIREFKTLLGPDRLRLLKTYWNELILIDIAFRSMSLLDRHIVGLNIWSDIIISEFTAAEAGISGMFERILKEIVSKLWEMRVDQREFILLKTIILFNPEAQGLKTSRPIEEMRNAAFTELENYCNQNYLETQSKRFGKLLLRLPALRSIGLKCNDHPQQKLVFLTFEKDEKIDEYLAKLIENR